MKHLLRKLFFWDAPAQGAFFGLTLLLLTIWGGFSIFCACLVAYCRTFTFLVVFYAFVGLIALGGIYPLLLLSRALVNMARRTPRFWTRLLKMLAALVVLTPLCTCMAIGLIPLNDFCHLSNQAAIWLPICTALCLLVLGVAYVLRPIVNPAKLLASLLAWTGAFLVFSTLLFLANPLEDRVGNEFNRVPDWFGQYVPYVVPFWRSFGLFGKGCFWFTLVGFLLLAIAYLLSWSILAKVSGCTMRRLCSRGIRVQWAVMAGAYVVTLCFALVCNSQYHNAVKELETHFGHPMTGLELGRVHYDGRTPDAAYWESLDAATKRYYKEYEKTVGNEYYAFETHLDAELPKELYEKRRDGFMSSLKASGLQEHFVSPMPPGERDYSVKWLAGMSLPELSQCRALARIVHRRCQYAIDSGDFKTAAEAVAHLDMLCDFLGRECNVIGYLLWGAVCLVRNEMIVKLLASGLPTDEWLAEQAKHLLQLEERLVQREKIILYSEAVCALDVFQFVVGEHSQKKEQSDIGDYLADWNYWINYKSIRFFFPQGWWLASKSARDYARVINVSTLDQFPKKATGSVLVDMLIPPLSSTGKKKNTYIASSRVLRGLISAELQRRRTGEYPDSLYAIPTDPFSGQPLKYRKGPCEVMRYYAKWVPDVTEEEAKDLNEPPRGNWTLEYKTETVDVVQIWSIGPDGKDNSGLNNHSSGEKPADDIRFIIPIK